MLVLAVLAAVSTVTYNQFVAPSRGTSAAAQAVAKAIQAKAAADDVPVGPAAQAAWTAAGSSAAFLTALGVDYAGTASFTAGSGGNPATLALSGSKGGVHTIVPPITSSTSPSLDGCATTAPPAWRGGPSLPQLAGIFGTPKTALIGNSPEGAAYSLDGSGFAVANYGSSTVQVFPVAADGALGAPKHATTESNPNGVAFSPGGTKIAVANSSANTVQIFPVAADGTLGTPKGATTGAGPYGVTFLPDGTKIVVANQNSQTVQMFPVAANGIIRTVTSTGALTTAFWVAFNPAGTLLAGVGATSPGTLAAWLVS